MKFHNVARLVFLLSLVRGNALSAAQVKAGLPELYELPSFEFSDQDAKKVTKASLIGKVWIADFIFTSCGDECPLLTNKLRSIQKKLSPKGKDVILISITTDPKTDTSKVLKSYAKSFKVDESGWRFLTGRKKDIVQLASTGFKFSSDEASPSHSQKFTLVDRKGWIRGYYDSGSAADLDKLVTDALSL